MKIAERTEEIGSRKAPKALFGLPFFFQQQSWPARLALITGALAIAILLTSLFVSYGSKLYETRHQTRLLNQAALMLQQGKLSEATQTARELLAKHPESLPALNILAEAAEKQNLEEAISLRERIAHLRPKDPDSQLNFASASL